MTKYQSTFYKMGEKAAEVKMELEWNREYVPPEWTPNGIEEVEEWIPNEHPYHAQMRAEDEIRLPGRHSMERTM